MIKAVLIAFTLMLAISTSVWAKDSTPAGATRKEKVEQKVASIKEKVASHETELKAKLQTFKDKRKAQVAERVNTNLNRINQNQTEQMLKHLDKMSKILDKLEARVNEAKPDIKDPNLARTAISDARSTVAAAKAAVEAQRGKDYTIQATSEAKIKEDAQKARQALHTDLLATRKQVIDAKQKVANAIRVAKSGARKEGTSSGQK